MENLLLCFVVVGIWPYVVLGFFLGRLKVLTYTQAVRGRPTLKDVIERLFWPGSVRELKESYTENKCELSEQICENRDTNCTDVNCFEAKYQIREVRNCEMICEEKNVADYKVSSTDAIDATFIISMKWQKDSSWSKLDVVKPLKNKVNFLPICIIMAICFLLLLKLCVFRVVLFYVQLFVSFFNHLR